MRICDRERRINIGGRMSKFSVENMRAYRRTNNELMRKYNKAFDKEKLKELELEIEHYFKHNMNVTSCLKKIMEFMIKNDINERTLLDILM